MKTFLKISIILFAMVLSGNLYAFDNSMFQGNVSEEKTMRIFPNPLSDRGFVEFENEVPGNVVLEFYDITGKKVKEIKREGISFGKQLIAFDISDLKDGIYLCRIKTNTFDKSRRVIVRR